jgi:hypothetical protein
MLRFVAFLACLFPPAVAVAQGATDPVLAQAVAELQPRVGRDIGRTYRLIAVRGEGRTLVFDVEFLKEASNLDAPQMASVRALGICTIQNRAPFFDQGRRLRVDARRAGRSLGSATVDRCPGRMIVR